MSVEFSGYRPSTDKCKRPQRRSGPVRKTNDYDQPRILRSNKEAPVKTRAVQHEKNLAAFAVQLFSCFENRELMMCLKRKYTRGRFWYTKLVDPSAIAQDP